MYHSRVSFPPSLVQAEEPPFNLNDLGAAWWDLNVAGTDIGWRMVALRLPGAWALMMPESLSELPGTTTQTCRIELTSW